MEFKNKVLLVKIAMVILVAFLMFKCTTSCENSSSSSSQSVTSSDGKIDAYVRAETVIKKFLKAPSTAEFCGYRNSKVEESANNYIVTGYVDSQNSFGAMIRAEFDVTLKNEAGTWSIEALTFEGKKIK